MMRSASGAFVMLSLTTAALCGCASKPWPPKEPEVSKAQDPTNRAMIERARMDGAARCGPGETAISTGDGTLPSDYRCVRGD